MSLLSAIGGMIGLAVGGPIGAALGSGIGSLAGGGDLKSALTSGLLGFGIGSIPGAQGFAQGAAGAMGMGAMAGGGAAANPLAGLLGGGGAATAAGGAGAAAGMAGAGAAGAATAGQGLGTFGTFLGNMAQNPLVMASLMEATQPRGSMMTPLQQQQMDTGERAPGYRGTAAPDYRYNGAPRFAMGGYIEGPGTGTSDSVPAMIYQNGGPVQEAMLSDGEFVMTERAVRGAGGGDRAQGAAKMYEMMSRLERRA
jgi:hypothetical protein